MPLKFYSTCSNTHAHVHHTPTCSEFHCMLSILERQLHVCHVLRRKIKSILYLLSPWIQKYMLSPTLPSCIWQYSAGIISILCPAVYGIILCWYNFYDCVQLCKTLYCAGIISIQTFSLLCMVHQLMWNIQWWLYHFYLSSPCSNAFYLLKLTFSLQTQL